MMRSMFAAVGGLRAHQTRMDVIGNNIANVNTVAFKSNRATFQDVFYQTMSSGSAGSATSGGINPKQVGVGSSVATIDTIMTQGNVQPTGVPTDMMIQGEGFFVLSNTPAHDAATSRYYYTRAGVFGFDSHGNLIHKPTGLFVVDVNRAAINIGTGVDNYGIDPDGLITWEGGTKAAAGATGQRIAIAKFDNPEGLMKEGENLYVFDDNASTVPPTAPAELTPGTGGRGTIETSALEMSNVDLAQEFTDMITTQRGYQANARTITTSDEMLQELVNLKR